MRKIFCIITTLFLCGCSVTPSRQIVRVPQSTQKVCQLTGAMDTSGGDTFNRTDREAKLTGTDLGASFSAPSGLVFFLFGDTEHSTGLARDKAADSIAYSRSNVDPEHCVPLTFLRANDGGFQPPHLFESVDNKRTRIPLGIFEVPTSGFVFNGSTYLTFATQAHGTPRRPTRSVLGKMPTLLGGERDQRSDFTRLYDLPPDKLLNVSSVLVDDTWHPSAHPTRVLFFGSGIYRASTTAYLATIPLADVDKGVLAYFTQASGNHAHWSSSSNEASGLFASDVQCIGELSVTWNSYLRKWLMLYNCDGPQRGILYRTAENPWGPWSAAAILFDPRRDKGYCYFIHDRYSATCPRDGANPKDDLVSRAFGADSYGGEYGAYVVDAYTKGDARKHSSTIYFTLSTWNPYQVVLMKATLVAQRGD